MSQAKGERPDPDDRSPYGFVFGGGGDVRDDPRPERQRRARPARAASAARPAVRAGRDDSRRDDRQGHHDRERSARNPVPVRILTETVDIPQRGTYTIQIVQDRTTEQQTLQVILFVLVVGGLLVLVVSFGFGTIYARRALVPIRESLAQPARRPAPPARVRGRRQPRAADAADRHPEQRRVPRAPPRRAGRDGRLGARGHRRRGPPHDRHRRGPAAAGPVRLRGGRAGARAGRPRRRRRRRGVGDGQARHRPGRPGRGRSRSRRSWPATRPASASS